MSYKLEPLCDHRSVLGEAPHWDVSRQSYYQVDINSGTFLRYDYTKQKMYKGKIEGEEFASFIIPVANTTDKFLTGCGRNIKVIIWDGVSATAQVDRVLFEVQKNDKKHADNRVNDGKCDPRGRLFAGTLCAVGNIFEHRLGELFKYEKGDKLEVLKTNVGISNGLAWNEKANKFYYIDSTDNNILAYDYDVEHGVPSNPKVIYSLPKGSLQKMVLLDGMTIDSDGNLYVAIFNGSSVHKINPNTGELLLEIKLPVKQVTSVAFGGPNLDVLFVTTGTLFDDVAPAGTTYKITGLGAKGVPMISAHI